MPQFNPIFDDMETESSSTGSIASNIFQLTEANAPKIDIEGNLLEVNIDAIKPKESNSLTLDFKNNDYISQLVQQETIKSVAKSNVEHAVDEATGEIATPTVAQVREHLATESGEELETEDYEAFSDIIVETLDWAISWALMAFALATSDKAYTIATDRAKRLKTLLTKTLIQFSPKMNVAWLFVIVLVVAYGKAGKSAYDHRGIEQEKIKAKKLAAKELAKKPKKKTGPAAAAPVAEATLVKKVATMTPVKETVTPVPDSEETTVPKKEEVPAKKVPYKRVVPD